jgi:hypothetical protein
MIKGPISRILPSGARTAPPDDAADQPRLPTLDERTNLLLRAVHGERDFTDLEHSDARDRLLDEMAKRIAAGPRTGARDPDLPGLPEGTGSHPTDVAVSARIASDGMDRAAHARPIMYSAREEAPASAGRIILPRRPIAEPQSVPPDTSELHGHVDVGPPFPRIDLSQNHPRRLLGADPRRPPAAKRRIFAAAAAIAATVLVVVGAYRLAWLPVIQPTTADSEVAVNQQLRDRPPDQIPNTTLARETGPKTVAPLTSDAIADMVHRGQALIASGKILAARFVLKEAADANSPEAALALGMTYDPAELDRLGIRDIAPEADTARQWYQKARDLGSPEAKGRLDRMPARENQAR